MGIREVSNVVDEERIEDSESTSSSSTSHYSDGAEPLLGNNLDDKSRASDKYSPPANLDEMERGVEVDIDSFALSSNFAETHMYQSDSDGDTSCGNHHATALYPEVMDTLGMQISLYACRRTN